MTRYKALTVVAGLMMLGGSLEAQAKPGLGMLPFTNSATGKANEELAPLAKGLADMAMDELVANPTIRVVERDAINKVMEEQKLSAGGSVDPQTVVKMGKIVGARYMLTGSYLTLGPKLVLTMRAFDVETTEIIWSRQVDGKVDEILVLINKLSAQASKGLKLAPLPPAQEQAQAKKAEKVQLPLQDALKFSRALDAKDRGKKEEAVALFNQVLDKFPDFELAKKEKASISSK
jgi:TolB-like protein